MARMTEALERNTRAIVAATQEQRRFNQIMLAISEKSGNAGLVKALLEGAVRMGARKLSGLG